VPVDASFRTFSGRIVYDTAHATNASATLTVATGSLDIGDGAYNAEVRKKSWFDSVTSAKSVFVSKTIKSSGTGRFDATGTLTLKGRALSITVPVTASATAAGKAFDGAFIISRKAFGIGDPVWDSVLDHRVTVRFHLTSSGR
jgi:polyisoprenoid-binding protein YceI